MYKKFIIGLVIVLIIVGLSGCTEFGIGITNIGDIKANPNDYLGKIVTIEGNCENSRITDDTGHEIRYLYNTTLSGYYRLTGEIESDYYTDFYAFEYEKSLYIYINVTKAKGI
jgi:hypothetical protein